jgi:hypothetical protein
MNTWLLVLLLKRTPQVVCRIGAAQCVCLIRVGEGPSKLPRRRTPTKKVNIDYEGRSRDSGSGSGGSATAFSGWVAMPSGGVCAINLAGDEVNIIGVIGPAYMRLGGVPSLYFRST